jgi:hypothetical protein
MFQMMRDSRTRAICNLGRTVPPSRHRDGSSPKYDAGGKFYVGETINPVSMDFCDIYDSCGVALEFSIREASVC